MHGTPAASSPPTARATRATDRRSPTGTLMDMMMRPPPTSDLSLPGMAEAMERVRLELELVRRDHPELTERQALREARRRCWQALVALADVREAKEQRARLSLDRRPGATNTATAPDQPNPAGG
jgi:hypothetical protein